MFIALSIQKHDRRNALDLEALLCASGFSVRIQTCKVELEGKEP